jgi:hypothetical protein
MKVVPLTLKEANVFISEHHRHHKPVQGHRFSLGLRGEGGLIGVCCVGRPVSRGCDPTTTAEVTRLATDGTANSCSKLLGAAARVCREMGFERIQTYTLESEGGASLRASGWKLVATTAGGQWKHSSGPRRTDQPTCPKNRWEKSFI